VHHVLFLNSWVWIVSEDDMEKERREHPRGADGVARSDRQVSIESGPAFYRALVDGCPDAIVVADREGLIRFWNAAAEATFGHAAAEAMGKSLDIIIPENLRKRHWTGYEAVMASGMTRYGTDLLKVPALHRSGHKLSIEFRVMLLRNDQGGVVGIAAFLRDVTTAWKEQQELRRRLAALRAPRGVNASR
jgi:PAS domain S-box-containing protein